MKKIKVLDFIKLARRTGRRYKTPMSADQLNRSGHPSIADFGRGTFVQVADGVVQYQRKVVVLEAFG